MWRVACFRFTMTLRNAPIALQTVWFLWTLLGMLERRCHALCHYLWNLLSVTCRWGRCGEDRSGFYSRAAGTCHGFKLPLRRRILRRWDVRHSVCCTSACALVDERRFGLIPMIVVKYQVDPPFGSKQAVLKSTCFRRLMFKPLESCLTRWGIRGTVNVYPVGWSTNRSVYTGKGRNVVVVVLWQWLSWTDEAVASDVTDLWPG